MNQIIEIYKLLLSEFGEQGWWPVTPKGEIKPKYFQKDHTNKQKFEIIVGAILTQNTAWNNVEKALENLNNKKILDVRKLKITDKKILAALIRPAGYFNQKAEYIKSFADYIVKNYKSELTPLFMKNIAELRDELLSLKGIGPETADSILLYAAEKPIFVVDAYTKRVFERIGYTKKTYEDFQNLFMENLERNASLFNEYHALIVELGKKICRKEPICGECPINGICNYYNNNLDTNL